MEFTANATAVVHGLDGDATSILSNILCLLACASVHGVERRTLLAELDTAVGAVFAV